MFVAPGASLALVLHSSELEHFRNVFGTVWGRLGTSRRHLGAPSERFGAHWCEFQLRWNIIKVLSLHVLEDVWVRLGGVLGVRRVRLEESLMRWKESWGRNLRVLETHLPLYMPCLVFVLSCFVMDYRVAAFDHNYSCSTQR